MRKPLATKQTEARAREEIYNKLSPSQKIKLLDDKLGKGVGSKRQRARLEAELHNNQSKK